MSRTYDVIINGGGMVGLALAGALVRDGFHCAVIDSSPVAQQWPADSVDSRVSAITAASANFFANLGAWDEMLAGGVSPYTGMQVWDGEGNGEVEFQAHELGEKNLGHIIENRVIRRGLYWVLVDSNADLICPAHCVELQRQPDKVTVKLDDGTRLHGKLVIGADGAGSWVREQLAIELSVKPYQQVALVTRVATEKVHGKIARQCFTREGPLAFLPLQDHHQCSIVWSMAAEDAQQLQTLDEPGSGTFKLAQRMQLAFEQRLGDVELLDVPLSFPLLERTAESFVTERGALIGDAAHTIHPLAGQGVNMGFLDAACLAQVLVKAREKGVDFGELRHLRPYQRWRIGETQLMSAAMRTFKNLFASDVPAIQWLRNVGMRGVNQNRLLRTQLASKAMGLEGDLPELCQRHNGPLG